MVIGNMDEAEKAKIGGKERGVGAYTVHVFEMAQGSID